MFIQSLQRVSVANYVAKLKFVADEFLLPVVVVVLRKISVRHGPNCEALDALDCHWKGRLR